jgi:hypothetical protein
MPLRLPTGSEIGVLRWGLMSAVIVLGGSLALWSLWGWFSRESSRGATSAAILESVHPLATSAGEERQSLVAGAVLAAGPEQSERSQHGYESRRARDRR